MKKLEKLQAHAKEARQRNKENKIEALRAVAPCKVHQLKRVGKTPYKDLYIGACAVCGERREYEADYS